MAEVKALEEELAQLKEQLAKLEKSQQDDELIKYVQLDGLV